MKHPKSVRSLKLVWLLITSLFSLVSFEGYSQCSALGNITSINTVVSPPSGCSQLTSTLTYQISFDAPTPAAGVIQIFFAWGDGTAPQTVPVANSQLSYNIGLAHTYPVNSDCEYEATTALFVDGIPCLTTVFKVLVNSYRTEAFNQGLVQLINPISGTNIFEVCEGDPINAVFNDLTAFNCNSTYIPTIKGSLISRPNEAIRWQQLVYNTKVTAGQRIPTVAVNGVPVINGARADIIANYQDPRGVLTLTPLVVNNDPRRRNTLNITAPGGFGAGFPVVNDIFEVKIRYWNRCNPYDDPLIPGVPVDLINGDNAPIEAIALIRVVGAPPTPTGSNLNYCNGTNPAAFSITGAGAGSTVRWYANVNGATPKVPGTVGALITTTVASGGGVGTLPILTAFPGFNNTVPDNYIVWASYTGASGSLTCESQKVVVIRSIREALTTPPVITSSNTSFPVCSGTNGVELHTSPAPGSNTIGGNWNYTWTFGAGALGTNLTFNPAGPTAESITFDIAAAATGAKSAIANRKYTSNDSNGSNCPSATRTFNFNVDIKPVGGSITGGTTPICEGSSTGVMTLSGHTGTIEEWQLDIDGGGFNQIPGPITTTTLSQVLSTAGTYTYRVRLGSGVCAKAFSATKVIVVNDRPTSSVLSGAATICRTAAANLKVAITGGASPYTVVYNPGAVSVAGYISGNNIPVSPLVTTTYSLVSVTDANGCTSLGLSGTPAVTISNPTTATLSGAANICPSASTNLTMTIAGGVGATPYTVNYTANGVAQVPVSGVSPLTIPVSPAITTTYILTSVTDNNGCPALSLLPAGGVVVTVGSVPTSATFAGGGSVCQNAAKNLTLTIVGGVSPYTITVTPSSGPVINFAGTYVSGSNIAVPTAAVGSINYNVTFVQDFCGNILGVAAAGNPQTVTVTPVPTATASVTLPAICSKASTNIDIGVTSSVSVPSTYTWTAAYTAGLTGGAAAGVGPNIVTGPLVNAGTNIVRNATFTITPTAVAGGCAGATFVIVQPVNVEPVGGNKTTASVCSNTAFSFDPQTVSINAAGGNSVPSSFTWSGSYPGGLTVVSAGTGTGVIAETLQNFSGAVITATYTVIPTATLGGCVGTSFTIGVPIFPQPVVAAAQTKTICSGAAVNYTITLTPAGAPAGTLFSWPDPDGAGPATARVFPGTTAQIGDILTNTTGADLLVTYAVTPRGPGGALGSCTGNPVNVVITVKPAPVISAGQTKTICGGSLVDLEVLMTPANAPAGTTFSWPDPDGVGPATARTILADPIGTLHITDNLTNTTGASFNVTYNITPTGPAPTNCVGTSRPVVITVAPSPVMTSAATNSICSGNVPTVAFTSNLAVGPTTFDWTVVSMVPPLSVGGTAVGNFGTGNINETLSNITAAPATVTYRVIPTGPAPTNCVGAFQDVVVTVNPLPLVEDVTGNSTVCQGNSPVIYSITNFNSLDNSTSYSWRITSAPGSFNRLSGGGGAVVNSGSFSPFVAAEGILVLNFPSLANGTVEVRKRNSFGCITDANPINISVVAVPVAQAISSDPPPFCQGQNNVKFFIGAPNGTSTYTWGVAGAATISGSSVGTTIDVNLGVGPSATISVSETNTAGCTTPFTPLVIALNPVPDFTSSTNSPICSGVNIDISLSEITGTAGTTFSWTIQNNPGGVTGAVAGGPTGPFVNPIPQHIIQALVNPSNVAQTVTYRIIATSGAGCSGLFKDVNVVVNPVPTLSVTSSPLPICSGATTNIQLFNSNFVAGTTFSWIIQSNPGGVTGAVAGGGLLDGQAITQILTNPTVVAQTVKYRITPSAAGCPGAFTDVDVIVQPTPVITNLPAPISICNGTALNFTPVITGFTDYSWTSSFVGTINPISITGSGTTPITDTPVNTGSAPATVTYRITPFFSGCPGVFKDYVVTVNPIPALSSTLTPPSICSGSSFVYVATSAVGGATFAWSRALVAGITQGANAGVGNVNETLTNTTALPINVTYVYTTSANGCSSIPENVVVTVNPIPTLSSTLAPAAICSGSTFGYTATSATPGATFAWTRALVVGISQIASSGTGNVSEVLTNTTTSPLNVTYVYTTSANGCSNTPQNVVVTVNPIPALSSTLFPPALCSGATFNYTPLSATAGATFAWSRALVAGITEAASVGTASVSETLTNTTTAPINVTYVYITTANTCSSLPQNVVVTVNPVPVLSSSLTPPAICSATTFTYTATSVTAGATFAWTRAVVAGISQGANAGAGNVSETLTNTTTAPVNVTYVYTTTANTCVGAPQNVVVTVNPIPVLSSSLTPPAICSGSSFNYTATSATAGATFAWSRALVAGISQAASSGTGNVSETLTNTTTGPINVTYAYTTTANGCSNTPQNVVVVVNPIPTLNSTLTPPAICSAAIFNYTATSATAGATFAWSRALVAGISQAANAGTGNVSETLTNTTTAPINVTYVYTVTANTCVGIPQNVVVVVNPIPTLSSSLTPPAICSTATFSYTATSATAGATFAWTRAVVGGISQGASAGAGNVSEVLTNTTTAPINVTYVYVTSANGCSNAPQNVVVVVNPIPVLSSTLTPAAICSAATFTYTATSATVGATFAWSRALVAGISQGASAGTGNVSEVLTNTTTAPINVTYAYVTTANGCSNAPQNVVVTVNPIPVLSSTLTPSAICSATTFSYTPTSATAGATFPWTRAVVVGISQGAAAGAGNVSETLTNTTAAPVSVTYVFTTTANGCSAPQNVVVVVNPIPTLSSTLAPPAICSGSTFNYLATSATVGSTFAWSRAAVPGISQGASAGAGNVSETLTNTTTAPVNVTYVYITSANGCSNPPQNVVVVVNPIPTLSSSLAPPAVCSGAAFNYSPTSATAGATFAWSRALVAGISNAASAGAGNVSETLNNTTTAPVSVTYVFVTTANTCVSTPQNVIVVINPIPTLSSTLTPPAICSATTFSYTPTSATAGATFAWTRAAVIGISQGAAAGAGNVSETLTNTTTAIVNVTYVYITTANGCSNTPQNVVVAVNPIPALSSTLLPPAICSAGVFNYTPTSATAGSTFTWSRAIVAGISQGASGGIGNVSETLTNTTTAPVNVTYAFITTANGCSSAPQNVVVTVNPIPVLSSTLTPPAICSATIFNYSATSATIGATFAWSRALVAGISQAANAGAGNVSEVLTNTTTAPINVTYVYITTANGCSSAPQNVVVVVNPIPVLSSTLTPPAICSTNTFSYVPASATVGATFAWSRAVVGGITQGASAGTGNVNEGLTNTTTAPINVTYAFITTANGCSSAPQNVVVVVNPTPVLNSTLTPPAICSGATFNYTATSLTAGATFAWSRSFLLGITQGPNSGTGNVSEVLTNTTTTPISVTYVYVTTANGCVSSPQNVVVVVNPIPTLNSTLTPPDICSGNTFSYVASSATPGATFAWSRAVVAGITQGASAGAGNVSEVLTNSTTAPVPVTYVYITSANGCVGTPQNVIVNVNPPPILSSTLTPPTICSGTIFNYTATSATAGASFAWSRAAVVGITEGATSGAGNVSEILTNTTASPVNVTYVYITSANGCSSAPQNVVVAVSPVAVVSPVASVVVCSGGTVGPIAFTSNLDPGVTYNWTNDNAAINLAVSGSGTISFTSAVNTGSIPIIGNISVTGTKAGCAGTPIAFSITVNPEPVLLISAFPDVCSTNTNTSNPVNIVLGTNGTSVNVAAAGYQLTALQYSTGGPFGPGLPAGLTRNGGPAVGAFGDINLVKSDTYTNTSANPITVQYTIRGTSVAGCNSAPQTYIVIINPQPQFTPTAAPLCSGIASGITLSASGTSTAIAQYELKTIVLAGSLTAVAGNAGTGIYNNGTFLSADKFINTTNGPLTVTYTIAAISTAVPGCKGPDQTVVFTVNPAPGMPNLDAKACSGSISGIVLADSSPTSVAAVSYDINAINNPGGMAGGIATVGNTANVNAIRNDAFVNPTNAVQLVTYVVVPVAVTGCKGPATNIVLTVEPTITAAPINHKAVICSSSASTTDPTDIELQSPTIPSAPAVNPIVFSYTASVLPIGSITGFSPAQSGLAAGFHITDNLVNNTNAVATITYMIRGIANGAANGAGCIGVAVPVIVTVEPKPKMVATPSTRTVCEGVNVNIALSSPTVPSGATAIEFVLISAVPTNTNGVVTGMSANGTVFANGATLIDNYNSTSTTSETVTYTFRPRMAAGAGCIGDDVIVTINVNPRPTLTATPPVPTAICSGDQFIIQLVSDVSNTVSTWPVPVTAPTAGSVTGASAGAGDQVFQILFNKTSPLVQTVTYTITPQASGCAGVPLTIPIQVNPVADVLGTATTTICHGGTLNIALTSKVAAGVSFAWTVDDPSGLGAPGAFDGGGATINQLFNNTTGAQASITYTIVPTLVAPGTTTGTCVGDSKIMFVTVAPEITAAFLNTPSPDFICKGSTEYLVFQFGGQAPFDFTYTKDIGGGPGPGITLLNKGPVVVVQDVPAVTTTYNITSVTSHVNGVSCITPFNVPFLVNVGDTDPNFSIITPLATCSPNRTSFQYNQVAGTIYTWRFGDTADSVYTATTTVPNMVIKHTYTNLSPSSTLNFPVSMQTELPAPFPGCFKSIAPKTITIYPNIIANVLSDKTSICSGETIRFSNQSVGATSQTWTYRVQGQVPEIAMGNSTNINFVFTNATAANPIIYEVIWRGTNGNCPTPDQIIPIQVYQSAIPLFNEGVLPNVISGHGIVNFTNTSTPPNSPEFIYDWTFGADSHIGVGAAPASFTGAIPPPIDYTRPGTKDIVLTVTNTQNSLCKYTFTKTINLQLLPLMATFTVTPTESCAPTTISVATVTATGDEFSWNVIDQNGRIVASSTGVQPSFNISVDGTYLITFKTSSSQDGQVAFAPNQTVKVYPKPFASFDARPDVVYIPDTELSTFNFSSGANQYKWDFNDGETSTEEEPKHTYKVEGIYDILLTAQNDHGGGVVCTDTLSRQIVAKQGGTTKVPNAFTPNPAGPTTSVGGGGGGQGSGGSFNDVFLPIVKGVEEFNLQIYDRWGNLIFESNSSQIGWDGYNSEGKLLPAGVYVYKLTLRLSDGQRSTQVGDVTMIR